MQTLSISHAFLRNPPGSAFTMRLAMKKSEQMTKSSIRIESPLVL